MKSHIVIGAGILGASAAYHLAKAGAKVTVIDRKDPGQATNAAAGIICPWLSQRRNKAWYALAKGGAAYYRTLIKELENDGETETGYQQAGAISLHTDPAKLEKMEERAMKRRGDAPEMGEITPVSPEQTSQLFPPVAKEYASVHVSGAARVNGRALRDALLRAAEKHGAVLVQGSAELVSHGDKVTAIKANGEQYEAETVIAAAGAWAGELFKPLGIQLDVKPQKAQIVHLQLEEEDTGSWPVVIPPNNQYILAFEGGRIVVGATHEDDMGYDLRVTAGGLNEIFEKALEIAPGLSDGMFTEAQVGFRPYTPGFLPIIGQIPGLEGLYIANGLGASGLTAGPFLGAQLARLALGQEVDIDLSLYDPAGAIKNG
ncbi:MULTISPECIES: NAD(P)/FAD-dependent oxidoreductase [unclassified Cytobacillus]|uniref:NAD(P)/FAD-dependent oxidoreductase n=1 Tax=unclassified Cytobacillus TaxID=2675268 RepID=UPI00135908F2|nr:FAD-dependent oxidoreductase [Cytobacillus sp. AMY 15.2]KAF0819157.1 D-amino acid dehydrogenase [Bacillus sp. ZZV12-4809]MCM3091820.1 FAD-binding oxidoreductase [Cytobacillus sp. AMY 15.2]